ncbi:MAG: ATP-dependent protease [Halioglobus sp.]|nr:ATP-dependent protease [Halioglobus sp.]
MGELPLFPLSAVLAPYGRMPLQIFEQRYLDLVRDSLRNESGFGVVWIRQGSEVAQRGRASPELGDHGTVASIVDWNQLQNGLLGITIAGVRRFDLYATETRADGLVVGHVEERAAPQAARMQEEWLPLAEVLRTLERHPHAQRLGLRIDYNDAWQVAYALVQLLPLEEALRYQLLGIDALEDLVARLSGVLNQLSGEQ